MRADFGVFAVTMALVALPAQGLADITDLGYVSFAYLIPAGPGSPGVSGFAIGDLTGDQPGFNSLALQFPDTDASNSDG